MIEIDDLTVKTHEGKLLLNAIDLSINKGETVLICGEPGSGKTLLLKAIKELLEDGLSVEGKIERNGKVGIVFQEPEKQIVRRKVRSDVAFELENSAMPIDEIEKRIKKYSSMLNADHLLDRKIDELSHGEITKVAILSMIVSEPDVILLDEPLSPLDYRNQMVVLDAIEELKNEGISILIAEHDIRDLYDKCDRIVLLKSGRLIGSGKPEDMLRTLMMSGIRLPFELELENYIGERE
ncbi:MAG: energy-coupling factor ABC transporter ATP-binding protein [Thermoplasmatota archaeon]